MVVKVNATTMTAGDWRMRAGDPFVIKLYNGLFKIKRTVLGQEFSGVVDSVGKNVTRFNKGDYIFGGTGDSAGGHAEYVAVPADGAIVHKPESMTNENAAALPIGALTALFFLRQADIKPGQKVLIYGASGSVGTYAVQLAKHFDAEVTGVCSSTNLEMVRSLGADKLIDYRQEDYAKNGEEYDVIFDAVGKTSFGTGKNALKLKGAYLTVAMSFTLMLQSVINSITGQYQFVSAVTKMTAEELLFLTKLVETGELKPVIDCTYPLSDIQTAHRHAQTGRKKGNIVIRP
ncbi:MAG: NADPH:quinone reductase-like Zn-dependent oxidoreductase [Bacteroidia bacterium]